MLRQGLNVGSMFTFKCQIRAIAEMTLFPMCLSLQHSKPQQKKGGKNTKTITSACDNESIEGIMRMNVRRSNK